MSRTPLVVGVSTSVGVMLAAILGTFALGWGLALGPPVACTLFAIGTVVDPEEGSVRTALLAVGVAALAFAAVSIPMTWTGLAEIPETWTELDAETVDEARRALLPRWIALGVTLVPVTLGLLLRRKS